MAAAVTDCITKVSLVAFNFLVILFEPRQQGILCQCLIRNHQGRFESCLRSGFLAAMEKSRFLLDELI